MAKQPKTSAELDEAQSIATDLALGREDVVRVHILAKGRANRRNCLRIVPPGFGKRGTGGGEQGNEPDKNPNAKGISLAGRAHANLARDKFLGQTSNQARQSTEQR